MAKKILVLLVFILILLFFFLFSAPSQKDRETGVFSIYFMEEKVGYEEYTWHEDDRGYVLTVKGRMMKPASLKIEELEIRVDRNFIADYFSFKGSVNGVAQEVTSSFTEGRVENTIVVEGQESKNSVKVRRNAFLLPNPIFSPYLVLTKKYRCDLEERLELSAYIIPQIEVPFSLEPQEGVSCSLVMELGGIKIELQTDDQGDLKALLIPAQKLEVLKTGF
jgi:hypothetical protein